MADVRKTWDDIPSLGELHIDWGYKPANPLGKRKHARMSSKDVASLFGIEKIKARVATGKQTVDGLLSDICAGGMALILNTELAVNQNVKIGFYLGKQKIISKAVVRQTAPTRRNFKVGFQFQDIAEEDSRYIDNLYATKILNRV